MSASGRDTTSSPNQIKNVNTIRSDGAHPSRPDDASGVDREVGRSLLQSAAHQSQAAEACRTLHGCLVRSRLEPAASQQIDVSIARAAEAAAAYGRAVAWR